MSLAERIEKVPIFSGLERKDLDAVAQAFREVSFSPGETIIKDSDRSPGFYVMLEGAAEARRGGEAVASLKPGEFFGELVALGFQRQRTADVVAVERCTCIVAGQQALQSLISRHGVVGRQILGEIRKRYAGEGQA